MASSTAAYAAGDQQWRNVAKGDETVSLKGKRRKTVWLSQQPRPLFVTEAEFKAAKYFTRVKKTLLVLYGSALMIVDVAALDAADSATAAGDISVAVLRLISYSELLDAFIVGSSGRTLKIEYGDSSDKPKLASSALVGLEAGTSTAATNGSSSTITTRDSNSLETSSIAASEAYSVAAGSTAAGGQAGAASLRVTYDSFTLVLKDATTAQEAAAALIFYRAQHAAAQHWLHQGLHAGFKCDTVALKAVPAALSSSSTEARGNGTARSREPSAGGAGNSNQPGPYPWGSVSSGWGCSVALPASWGSILDTAEDSAPANAADGADIVLEDLSCPLGLSHGPQALQLQFTTPLGLAAATIKPQHVRAALLSQQCRQILAVPAQRSGGLRHHQQPQQQGVVAGFSWTVTGRVPAGSSQDGSSSSNLVGVAASAPSATSLAGNAAAELGASSSGLTTSHSVEVFAAVTVEVHRTPHTAGRRGAGRVYNPAIPAAVGKPPEADKKLGQQQGTGSSSPHQAAAAAASSTGSNGKLVGVQQLQPVQVAVCAVIAVVAAMQWGTQPAVAVVQMLLAIVLAGMTWYAQSSRHSSSTDILPPASSSCSSNPAADAVDAADSGSDYTDASAFETDDSMTATQEDITCCGWSLRLIAGDVVATPSQYLQLQVSIARADRGLAQLRQRMLSMSQSMSLSFGGAPPLSVTAGLPVLVSEPEPAWLYPDNKQRFLNAKPTLAASQEQAQRTHKWRLRTDIDNVLRKPCPGFEAISSVFPTYTLMNNSPEGHAVVMMKVGAVKDLCDLVFNPPEGKGVTLEQVEQTLALFNEYLVHVAAPDPLPAGFQVQIYDFEGFKLGYVNSDMITLFKILVRFGHYYPERLKQALVINAPAWFTYPWKMMSSFLDANTSAKVVVVGPAKTALSTLAHHMGGVDNVPVAWGGKNTTPLAQFPDHQQMMEFARRLNAGEQPLKDCKKVSAMFAEPQ